MRRSEVHLLDPVNGGATPDSLLYTNGYLNISVVNTLVSPVNGDSIRINVYVRGGEDFELHGPSDDGFQFTSYYPHTGAAQQALFLRKEIPELKPQGNPEETSKVVDDVKPDEPTISENLVGETFSDSEKKPAIFFGESDISFRDILKRYNLVGGVGLRSGNLNNDDSVRQVRLVMPDFPSYYGWNPNSFYNANIPAGGTAPFTANFQTLLNYLTPAYVARRGAMSQKYVPRGVAMMERGNIANYKIYRQPSNVDEGAASVQLYPGNPNNSNSMVNTVFQSDGNLFQGAWTGAYGVNPCLSIQPPFYSPYRFLFAQHLDVGHGLGTDNANRLKHEINFDLFQNNMGADGNHAGIRDSGYERWIAAGEDFDLIYFPNAPLVYEYLDDPTPLLA